MWLLRKFSHDTRSRRVDGNLCYEDFFFNHYNIPLQCETNPSFDQDIGAEMSQWSCDKPEVK